MRGHCTLPAKLHLQEGWWFAAHWLNPYLSEGMRGPLHTRYTSSVRRDMGPTADWLNLILRMDEGLGKPHVSGPVRDEGPTVHWVNLISQAVLGTRGPLHTRYTSSARRDEGSTADWLKLILRMDEGLVAHWVKLIFQGQLGMRAHCTLGKHPLSRGMKGPLHTR